MRLADADSVWNGIACFGYFIYHPAGAGVLAGLFMLFFLIEVALRRRAGHFVRCSLYGAMGGVLDKSMAGF
ncbi:hypothetical protein [Streptomyces sp. NWU339]|uniref:hypothetical protein n=1 Tax=Streptomyces sp. NWU339 TaxID=2185284 RepID=UPI00215A542E|nr:hypothetical protein [Streptomyces sp. NWU339]